MMKIFKVLATVIGSLAATGKSAAVLENDTARAPGSGYKDSCIHGGIFVENDRSHFFSACLDGSGYYVTSMIDLNLCYAYNTTTALIIPKKHGNFEDEGCHDCDVPDDDHTLTCYCENLKLHTNLNAIIGNDFGVLSCWGEHGVPLTH